MCGITGFLAASGTKSAQQSQLRAMTNAITHRGPDDCGFWFEEASGLALGHRRLAIIDLSAEGHQPMASPSGRYVVVYNGEIYNFRDLRRELQSTGRTPQWRGHSDTEVLVAGFDAWGIHRTLERLNGMFAFAVWDRSRRVLTLARDRMGEKPLYFGRMGKTFLFGSELGSLQAHASFRGELDRDALTSFLRFGYVPAPKCIWRNMAKLLPGHLLEVSEGGESLSEPVAYWDSSEVAVSGTRDPLPHGPELKEQLAALLNDAVGRRMEADVPLGAFLSGGVDSSLIVALMQAQSSEPIRTFTIGFADKSYDEAGYARDVAKHLGTHHTELEVTQKQALEVIPRLPTIWSEPFADSSQIPTYLVSEMTRRDVAVSLSGDGGDELFGGYNRYSMAMRLWKGAARIPRPIRGAIAGATRSSWGLTIAETALRLLPASKRPLAVRQRLHKIGHVLDADSSRAMYQRLVSSIHRPDLLVLGGERATSSLGSGVFFDDFRNEMMFIDALTYLPDDILTKVDRASMAVSLEARVPFLDHRVVELAWRLPMKAKINKGVGKAILRDILYDHVPPALIDRPKMGFGLPGGEWLRGPLSGWCNDLLSPDRIRAAGILNPEAVEALRVEGLRNGSSTAGLWHVLMFQAWWDAQGGGATVSVDPSELRQHA